MAREHEPSPVPPLILPTEVAFGDQEVGTNATQVFHPMNAAPHAEAFPTLALDGAPAFSLVESPLRLRPIHEGFDPTKAVKLHFAPTHPGRVEATLKVESTWAAGGFAPRTDTVRITGAAHAPGKRTTSELERERAETDRQRAAHEQQDREAAQVRRDNAAFLARDFDIHQGFREELNTQRLLAVKALDHVFARRQLGVTTVAAEIARYRGVRPAVPRSLAAQLGFYALQAAGILIGNQLSGGIATMVGALLTHTEYDRPARGAEGPVRERTVVPTAVVSALANGLREMFKQATKDSVKSMRGAAPEASGDTDRTALDFIEAQGNQLIDENGDAAAHLISEQYTLLLRQLEGVRDPGVAKPIIGIMAGFAATFRAQADQVGATQALQTRLHWMRLLAHASSGANTAVDLRADGKRTRGSEHVMNAEAANVRFNESAPAVARAGLVDVLFTASFRDPQRPIEVSRLRINGISRTMIDQLDGKTLGELGVPLRALGNLESPTATVTLVRDEAENVSYTDNTADEWQRATWLSRVAGTTSGSQSDQERGARRLFEQQILAIKVVAAEVENDSVDES